MKTAFITDTHFGVRNNSAIFLKNYEKFYSKTFFPTLVSEGIDTVVHLGDLWEDRKAISPFTFQRTRDMFFDPMKALGIKMHMILGNHDVFYRNSNSINTLEFLNDIYPNINVIPKYDVIDIGTKFGLISWLNKENIQDGLNWLETVDCNYIGGHFEINGFEMTKGHMCESGLSQSIFNRFEKTVSGHFHVRSSTSKIKYLSNPSQTTWADNGLLKGFHIFDSKTGGFTPVDNPYEMFRYESWNESLDPNDFKDVFGRVSISGKEVNKANLDIFVSAAQEQSYGLQVIDDEREISSDLEEEEYDNTSVIIEKYLESISRKDTIQKEKLKTMFFELYSNAAALMEVE